MTKRIAGLLTWLWAGWLLCASAAANEVRLQVDLQRKAGPVPYTYRAGVFLNSLPAGYPMELFLSEQRPGMVEFSWDFYQPLLQANSEGEFFSRLPGSSLTTWVRATAAAGGEPYIRLMPVPKWLWSAKDGFRKPPRDWQGWERFVNRLVDYFNNQLQIDARYIVWDEPDNFWHGSMDEYLLLYKHAAAGLLRANAKARIGGPAVAFFNAGIGKRGQPLLPAFVRYCANTPLPGLAPRLPIDILAWHTFDSVPANPGQFEMEVKAARKLLEQNGYRERVELNVGSWSPLEDYPDAPHSRDSEFLGAYIVSSAIAMRRAGVDRHAFFNLFEDWRRNRDEFSNDMGLTTRSYVVKAGYHAYRLLGRLKGSEISVTHNDPFLQAAAAGEGRTFRIIVSNFAPPRKMLRVLAQKQLMEGGRSPEELKRLIPPGEKLDQVLQDRRRIESWQVPADVRAAALRLHDAAQLSGNRKRSPLELQIAVNHLPAGRYRIREYRVDAAAGNAFSRREAVEKLVKQGRAREVNSRSSETVNRPQERVFEAGPGDSSVFRVTLPPYGVVLIEAERN